MIDYGAEEMEPLGDAGTEEVVLLMTNARVKLVDRSEIFVEGDGLLFILDENDMRIPVAVLRADSEAEGEA